MEFVRLGGSGNAERIKRLKLFGMTGLAIGTSALIDPEMVLSAMDQERRVPRISLIGITSGAFDSGYILDGIGIPTLELIEIIRQRSNYWFEHTVKRLKQFAEEIERLMKIL